MRIEGPWSRQVTADGCTVGRKNFRVVLICSVTLTSRFPCLGFLVCVRTHDELQHLPPLLCLQCAFSDAEQKHDFYVHAITAGAQEESITTVIATDKTQKLVSVMSACSPTLGQEFEASLAFTVNSRTA